MTFAMQSNPHIINKRTTRSIMLELSGVIGVVALASIIYNFVARGSYYGLSALLIIFLAVLFSSLCDALYALPILCDKKEKDIKVKLKNWGIKILDSYGYVSGLIFALLLPVGASWYVVLVGSVIGTLIAKSLFGGFGKNVFNPAIAGRVFVQVCFPSALTVNLDPELGSIQTGSTFLFDVASKGWLTTEYNVSLGDMFLGNYSAALGETFGLILILALVYLIVRDIIDWRISVTYLVTLFVISLLAALCGGLGANSFEFALRMILGGGALFGAVICYTDPVTSPTSRCGKIIFALGGAILTAMIRFQAAAIEGVAFSILLMNMLTPLIDKLLVSKQNKKLVVKAAVIGGIALVGIAFGCVYGATHNINANEPTTHHQEVRKDVKVISNSIVTLELEGEIL